MRTVDGILEAANIPYTYGAVRRDSSNVFEAGSPQPYGVAIVSVTANILATDQLDGTWTLRAYAQTVGKALELAADVSRLFTPVSYARVAGVGRDGGGTWPYAALVIAGVFDVV